MLRKRLHRIVWAVLLCGLLAALSAVVSVQSAAPEGFTVRSVTQEDLDGDGYLDHTTINCSFAGGNDRVDVYDGSGDMVASSDWREATDFDDDTWVFDVDSRGRASLVIQFSREGEDHVACLHDDRDADGDVDYVVQNGKVLVNESRFWTARVLAHGPWWTAEGEVNYDLLVSIDGPIGMSGLDTDYALSTMANDGSVDLEMEVRTDWSPELPSYSLAQSYPRTEAAIPRTVMRVNVPGTFLPRMEGYVFWPHLGPGLYSPGGPWEVAPTLKMDWERSCFQRQGVNHSIIQSTPPEVGWRVYSSVPVVRGVANRLNFENPFSFYDLAADADGWPELIIRNEYAPPGGVDCWSDERFWIVTDPRYQRQVFRYTWDQDNDGYWDYKLGLAGANDMDWVVHFPDFDIVTIPYGDLPWVLTDQMKWAAMTFVHATAETDFSSEGIYDWPEIRSVSREFLCGAGDRVTIGPSDARKTLRGEFRSTPTTRPQLYVSPVDRALHLVGAEAGVYNIDDARRVRYADLDGDGFFDAWTLTERPAEESEDRTAQHYPGRDAHQGEERVLGALWATSDLLIYAHADRVRAVQSSVQPSLFTTAPPRDHAEWLALGAKLEQYGTTLALDDLPGMLLQFHGPSSDVTGATLDGFRLTEQGLRFVLRLAPGFEAAVDDLGLGVSDLEPGAYAVTYDGSFRTQILTRARLTVTAADWSCEPALPERLAWATVGVTVRNTGLTDAQSLPVHVYASQVAGEPRLLVQQELDVDAQGSASIEANWAPPSAGVWRIWLDLAPDGKVPADIEVGALADMQIEVAAVPMPEMFQPLASYDGIRFTWPVALLLGGISMLAVCMLAMILTHDARVLPQQPGEED